ncbi:BON domain-containing protein [Pararhizobium arenae]|uniref:BON domain-containing protein n=1 Tax=Pararhizobium arenae TaxID=1856850 RepID=UPI00094B3C93|nr:BON domain-containing protein [Pararhizobium arenae]
MVFKERTFHGHEPEDMSPGDHHDLETRVANYVAAVAGLDASEITVVANGSTILLAGFVQTAEEVQKAEEAAASVAGVSDVINRITATDVRSTSMSS